MNYPADTRRIRHTDAPRGVDEPRLSPWHLLLLVPLLATIYPPLYNRATPTLLGWPFFYWYQTAWLPLSALIVAVVVRKTRRRP